MDIQHMIFLNPKVLVAIREIHILKNDFSLTHHQENYYKKAERIPSYEKENCGHHPVLPAESGKNLRNC